MIYEKGAVIEKRGIVFKDDDSADPKGVRPVVLAIAVDSSSREMFFLTLTSQTQKYFERPEYKAMYFLLKKTEDNRLHKSSLVNLQNIYKTPVSNEMLVANITDKEYRNLVRKLIEWQEHSDNPDEYFEELKRML